MAPQTIDLLVQVAASLIFLCSHTRCCEVDSNFPGDNNDYEYLANTREFLLDLNCFNCNGSGDVYWIESTVDHNGVRSETHKSSSVQTTVNTTTVFQCINTNAINREDPWRSKAFIIYFELNSTECSLLPSSSIMPSSCGPSGGSYECTSSITTNSPTSDALPRQTSSCTFCSTASNHTLFPPTPSSSSMVALSQECSNTTFTTSIISTIPTTVCPSLTDTDTPSLFTTNSNPLPSAQTMPSPTSTAAPPDTSSLFTTNSNPLPIVQTMPTLTSTAASPGDVCWLTNQEMLGLSLSLLMVIASESLLIVILCIAFGKRTNFRKSKLEPISEIAISNVPVLEMDQRDDVQDSAQSDCASERM